jgi:hypothetical protein
MKIIKVANQPRDPQDPGHLEIPFLIDYVKGLISGYTVIETEAHLKECPFCQDNYLTISNDPKIKQERERSKPLDQVSLDLDNSWLDDLDD